MAAMVSIQFMPAMVIGEPMAAQAVSLGQPMGGRSTLLRMGLQRQRTPFGERLFQARTYAGLSQGQLAKLTGLSQGTVGELEWKGESSVYAVRLAMACGVRPEWLAEDAGPMVDHTTWPFRRIELETIQALEAEDRAYLEGVMSSALEKISTTLTPEEIRLRHEMLHGTTRKQTRRKAA